ncbi:MAG: hypothetical protein KGJ13_03260 [Patescibacteria group bacterium]|nr:hypothetical protein [Patescibacteria group bacterium]
MAGMKEKYAEKLAKRSEESKVYRKFQLIGLEIADILKDRKHKALYIKLAKEGDSEKLLQAAKAVAERKEVKNKGAYFMSVIQNAEQHPHH